MDSGDVRSWKTKVWVVAEELGGRNGRRIPPGACLGCPNDSDPKAEETGGGGTEWARGV